METRTCGIWLSQQFGGCGVECGGEFLERAHADLAFAGFDVADVRLAEVSMSSQVDLPPASGKPSLADPATQPLGEFADHRFMVGDSRLCEFRWTRIYVKQIPDSGTGGVDESVSVR